MTPENKSKTTWRIINNASGNIKISHTLLCSDKVKHLFN